MTVTGHATVKAATAAAILTLILASCSGTKVGDAGSATVKEPSVQPAQTIAAGQGNEPAHESITAGAVPETPSEAPTQTAPSDGAVAIVGGSTPSLLPTKMAMYPAGLASGDHAQKSLEFPIPAATLQSMLKQQAPDTSKANVRCSGGLSGLGAAGSASCNYTGTNGSQHVSYLYASRSDSKGDAIIESVDVPLPEAITAKLAEPRTAALHFAAGEAWGAQEVPAAELNGFVQDAIAHHGYPKGTASCESGIHIQPGRNFTSCTYTVDNRQVSVAVLGVASVLNTENGVIVLVDDMT